MYHKSKNSLVSLVTGLFHPRVKPDNIEKIRDTLEDTML